MRLILLGRGTPTALDLACRALLDPNVTAGPHPGDNLINESRLVATESVGLPLPDGPFRRVADAILAYRVFPDWLLTGILWRIPLQTGDTFGSIAHLLPGVGVYFAGRVKAVIDEPCRAGFTLQTVKGHPVTGEETIAVEKDASSGKVIARISSWSRPGSRLTSLGSPLMRWMQRRAVKAGLANLGQIANKPLACDP